MELIDKKVYRLNVDDYYSVIDFGGHCTVFGFSQNSRFLLDETMDYARRYKHGAARVKVYCRCSLGCEPDLIASVAL